MAHDALRDIVSGMIGRHSQRGIALAGVLVIALSASASSATIGDGRWPPSAFGQGLTSKGHFFASFQIHREELEKCEATRPKGDRCLELYFYVTIAAMRASETKAAERYARDALALAQRTLPASHADIGTAYGNLGSVYGEQGNFRDAERYHRLALEIRRAALPPFHRDVGESYNNLAWALTELGRGAEAETLSEKAAKIAAQNGESGSDAEAALAARGTQLDRQRRFAEAELSHRRALDVALTRLPPEHPQMAGRYNDLAANLINQGKLAEAEPLLRKAIAIQRSTGQQGNTGLATAYFNLGSLLSRQSRYEDALVAFEASLAIYKTAYPDNHPVTGNVHFQIGGVQAGLRRRTEAEAAFRAALVCAMTLPVGHTQRIEALQTLALLLRVLKRDQSEVRALLAEASRGALEQFHLTKGDTLLLRQRVQTYQPIFRERVRVAWSLAASND